MKGHAARTAVRHAGRSKAERMVYCRSRLTRNGDRSSVSEEGEKKQDLDVSGIVVI